ncbi:MAG: hypothetical protein CL946_09200 [Ectothiorhodospiraceae bacterium]|nr:hypothetical protein [Ectothiorhodospiraceae bacterium]
MKDHDLTDSTLKFYAFDDRDTPSFKLTKDLTEISGFAMDARGRLFGHGDEEGVIYQIDPASGEIVKTFDVGSKKLKEDFEGLAIAGKTFYLVNSSGELFEFEEGANGEAVEYTKYSTHLSGKNDVEGLCYDPVNNSLLLACKDDPGKGLGMVRAVYEFSLFERRLASRPVFTIAQEDVSDYIAGSFMPSGIEYIPGSNTFYIIASKGFSIVEINRAGDLLGVRRLNGHLHDQPEAIAIAADRTLYIGDEGGDGRGFFTVYTPTEPLE